MDAALIAGAQITMGTEKKVSQLTLRSRRGFLEGEVDPGKAVMGWPC